MKPVIILGEARNDAESKTNSDFTGPAGAELIRMLGESGLITLSSFDREYLYKYYKSANDATCLQSIWALHPEIYLTNVFKLHPPRSDIEYFCGPKTESIPGYPALIKSKYIRAEFEPELDRLAHELLTVDPNLIICLGNTALWAMAGQTGIMRIRGTTLLSTHTAAGFKLLPTYHPSAVHRQWELRPTVIADFMKSKRESAYAEIRRPPREIWIEPSLDDIRRFTRECIVGCELLSVDIETSGSRVTCIGFAPAADVAIVIPFDDARAKNGNYWPTREAESECWSLVRGILRDPNTPKLFQNGAYDITFLLRAYGIQTINAVEDTMLLQHALMPEALKGLGYLGSIYSDEGTWKGMRKKNESIKRDS